MNGDRLATAAGFLGALLVLAGLVWLVGLSDVLGALAAVRPAFVALILGIAVCWLIAWGMALRTVLAAMGASISVRLAAFVFAAAVFSNNVTPFGQAGGEPVSAYIISRAADSEYETGLAAIASVDALHFGPSLAYAAAGLLILLANAVQVGRSLAFAAVAIAALAAAIPIVAYLGWRYRHRLERGVVRAVTPVVRLIGRALPRRTPPTAAAVEHRIDGFFAAIDRVGASRTTLLEAIGFSAVGWLALCGSLWLSLYALGESVPVAAVLLVVPMGAIAGVTPLPGGLGGVEAVQVALLVSTTGVSAAVAGAAVLVHRGATYWFPTVVGGGVAFALGTSERATVE